MDRPLNWKNPHYKSPTYDKEGNSAHDFFEAGANALLSLAADCIDNWRDAERSQVFILPSHTRAYIIQVPLEKKG